jgi:hypothetical protein
MFGRQLHTPLDFISWVQTWISSWTSSGWTCLRVQDSCQCGLGGAADSLAALAAFAARAASLDPKTFLKKGMVEVNSGAAPLCRAAYAVGGRYGAEGSCACGQ